DVERHPETLARGVREAPFEVVCDGEGDRVHEQVEATLECLADLAEDALEVLVGPYVAGGNERRGDRLRELAHALLDPLALVGEGELGASLREPVRDRPGDRALVRDAEDETAFAGEGSFHDARVYAAGALGYAELLAPPTAFLLLSAALVLATAAAASAQLQPK